MSPNTEIVRPEWSVKIESLRRARKGSQADFGRGLGVSAMAISRWERGASEPSGQAYIRLGNLAGDPLCWFFWERAGLRLSDITRVLPAARRRLSQTGIAKLQFAQAGSGKKRFPKVANLVAVPLLPVHAGTHGCVGDNTDLSNVSAESILAAPVEWCPNPGSTVCLRVKGNSMSPLILDGYIIAVDLSENQNDYLVGQIVLASHKEKGLLVSRLIRFDHTDALVSDQRDYESVPANPGSAWRTVGKVVWWAGRPK